MFSIQEQKHNKRVGLRGLRNSGSPATNTLDKVGYKVEHVKKALSNTV